LLSEMVNRCYSATLKTTKSYRRSEVERTPVADSSVPLPDIL
jgi:hypothetical protein